MTQALTTYHNNLEVVAIQDENVLNVQNNTFWPWGW